MFLLGIMPTSGVSPCKSPEVVDMTGDDGVVNIPSSDSDVDIMGHDSNADVIDLDQISSAGNGIQRH